MRRRILAASAALLTAAALVPTGASAADAPTPPAAVASGYERGPAPTDTSAETWGPFDLTQVTIPDKDTPGFGGADLYLPKDRSQTYGGIVMMPGWSGPRATVQWMAPRLASQGFVVLLLDSTTTLDMPEARDKAYRAAISWFTQSELTKGRLDTSRLGIWGYSMSGGGSLRTAEALPGLKAAVHTFPWDTQKSFAATTTPTLVLAAQLDTTAPTATHSKPMYASLTNAPKRQYVELAGAKHLLPLNEDGRLLETATTWFKLYVDEDTRYADLVCSTPKDPAKFTQAEFRSTVCPADTARR